MKPLILGALLGSVAFAASPATCYPATGVTSITTIAQYNNAANWSSTSHGTAGTCAASGGATTGWWGNTVTLVAGVPGAHNAGGVNLDDSIDIPADTTVSLASGMGQLEFGSATFGTGADAIHVHGTSSTVRGVFAIGAGTAVLTNGASSSGFNFALIDQYGVFCVQPNGALFEGAVANGPQVSVSGGLYVGWGDQTAYPVPAGCSPLGNAGGWVTASVAATLNFSGSLPAGLAVKDIVELDRANQPNGVWPYTNTFDGITPPPNLPVMPLTNDATTCGTLTSCYVPESTMLCVVAISGSTVSLGWPAGGNPWMPYCTGAETAMNITNAGSGLLWLKKPAFYGQDPRNVTWSNAQTYSPSGLLTYMDGVRSSLIIPFAPISNAAGTGPGRPGDTSLSATFTSPAGLGPCTKLRVSDVTSGTDCYYDPQYGAIVAHGFGNTWTSSVAITYKSSTAGSTRYCSGGGFGNIPTGARTYNEMVFYNADIWSLQGQLQSYACIQFSQLPNTVNNRMGLLHSTMRDSEAEIGIYGGTQDINHQLELNYNVLLNSNITTANSGPHFVFWATASNVDISNNRLWGMQALAGGANNNTAVTLQTFDTIRVTNNFATADQLWGGNGFQADNWSNSWIQQNRIQGFGAADNETPNLPAYVFGMPGLIGNHAPTGSANKDIVRGNYLYGLFRCMQLYTNVQVTQNSCAWARHHVAVLASSFASEYHHATYNANVEVDHNIVASPIDDQALYCWQTGYDGFNVAAGFLFHNNTCLASSAGFMFGDTDGGASLLAGPQVYDNVFAQAPSGAGLSKAQPGGFSQTSTTFASGNANQLATSFYAGVGGGNPENVPNPNYYRNGTVTLSGANYNLPATARNVTGVTIQNPNFQSQKTIALQFTHTSASNMTLAESTNGGVGYGTAAQLNWGGSGVTYTIAAAGVTDPGVIYDYLDVTVTGTPFAASGTPLSTLCPAARWAVMLTGANAGTVYGIPNCLSTSQIVFEPRVAGIAAGDTFAILNSEITLLDQAGANGIDVGLLGTLQSLPATSQTDTGIVVTPSDYCSFSGQCGALGIISGLPTTFTAGVWNGAAGTTSPVWPIALPELGGSSEAAHCAGQAACGGVSYFTPIGQYWMVAGQSGGYIGAVAPASSAAVPTGIVP